MANTVPHLHRNRHGTYYFRITEAGKTIKRSLRTKSVELATMRAACLNYEWDTMNRRTEPTVADIQKALAEGRVRKFDVELPNGVKLKNINNDDDARRAKELLANIGPITQPIATRPTIPEPSRTLGPRLRAAFGPPLRGSMLHAKQPNKPALRAGRLVWTVEAHAAASCSCRWCSRSVRTFPRQP